MDAAALCEREKWNRRYRDQGPEAFGTEPTAWLREHRDLLEALGGARALDLACGNGKNALYLVRLGFRVEALDISDVAVDYVTAEAERLDLGSRLEVRRADLRCIELREERHDGWSGVAVREPWRAWWRAVRRDRWAALARSWKAEVMPELGCRHASPFVCGTSGLAQTAIEIVVVGLVVNRCVVECMDQRIVHCCAQGFQHSGHGRKVSIRQLVE